MINLIPRDFQLLIDGLDCTTALSQITGGFSHFDSSGLIKISGELELKRPLDWTEDLDDRTNSRWARGKEVLFLIGDNNDTLQPAPILGRLYILSSEYDEINTLKIELGCKLTLLDYRTPPGEGYCVPVGTGKPFNEIGEDLLAKAGITGGFQGELPGNLYVPTSKLGSESYIGLFGKLCYAQGRFAYQGNDGQIYVQAINLSPAPLMTRWIAHHTVEFQRLTGVEKPCEKITVAGVKFNTKPVPPQTTSDSVSFGPANSVVPNSGNSPAIVERKARKETISGRQVTVEEKIWKPLKLIFPEEATGELRLLLAETSVEVKKFEPKRAGTEENCFVPSEGRLLVIEKEVEQLKGIAIKEWLANKASEDDSYPVGSIKFQSTLAQQSESKYLYSTGSIPLEIETEVSSLLGAILPFETDLNPISLELSSRKEQFWEKHRPGDFEQVTQENQSFALASPDALAAMEEVGDVPIQTKLALTFAKRDSTRSNSGQAQPPAPERFPPVLETTEEQLVGVAELPPLFDSQFREREREYSVGAGLLSSQEQAKNIAHIEGAFLWGRHKGSSFIWAFADALFSAFPLAAIHWVQPGGKKMSYLLDGLSISFADRRCVVAADGVWVGFAGTEVVEPPVIIDPPAPSPEDSFPTAPPYQQVENLEFAMGWGFEVSWEYVASYSPSTLRILPPERDAPLLQLKVLPGYSPVINSAQVATPDLRLEVGTAESLVANSSETTPAELRIEAIGAESFSVTASGFSVAELSLEAMAVNSPAINFSDVNLPELRLGAEAVDSPTAIISEVTLAELRIEAVGVEALSVTVSGFSVAELSLGAIAVNSPAINFSDVNLPELRLSAEAVDSPTVNLSGAISPELSLNVGFTDSPTINLSGVVLPELRLEIEAADSPSFTLSEVVPPDLQVEPV